VRLAWILALAACHHGEVEPAATCTAALMRSAANAERLLPETLLRALERIMGLLGRLLAAVAVELIAGGIRDMLHPP